MQLIDAGMVAFSGFHALKGRVDWPLTFQVPRMLRATVREAEDSYVLCWNAERLRKRELWPEYRDRPEIWDEAGREDFDTMLRVLSALGAVQYRADGWEADEVLAALAHRFQGEEELVIRSDDKDFMQLLSDTTWMEGRVRGEVRYDDVKEILGVTPPYVADLLALAGDEADGIPGLLAPSEAREVVETAGHVADWIDGLEKTGEGGPSRAGTGASGDTEDEVPDDGAEDGGAEDGGARDDDRFHGVREELLEPLAESTDQLRLNLELVDLSEEAVGEPPEPMLEGWGDLEAAREAGRETEVGWLADEELAEEYAVLREWGEKTRDRLGV